MSPYLRDLARDMAWLCPSAVVIGLIFVAAWVIGGVL